MKRNHPAMPEAQERTGINFDLSPQALARWNPSLAATDGEAENSINILDQIGMDFWTGEGTTAKRISAALRSIGADKNVTVNINSPGGSAIEGIAIYNLLRMHKGQVTVRILGMAASAASVIAMAGDEIQIARSAWLMVHNNFIAAYGNRNDFRDVADWLEPFDRAAADLYAERTGIEKDKIAELMDKETWIGGSDAVDNGWADCLLEPDKIGQSADGSQQSAIRRLDALLAKTGLPRSERKKLFQEIKSGTPSAAGDGTPAAAVTGTPGAALPFAIGSAASLSASLPGIFAR